MGPKYIKNGLVRLDCIATVVDALRLKDEFGNGEELVKENIGEEDLENLVIQQIEFCNIVLLNKAAEVEPRELGRIKEIIRAIQPKAEIIECNYGDVELSKLIDTHMFDFDAVATSAAWIDEIENHHGEEDEHGEGEHHDHDEDEEEHHGHDHHHHDHDDEHGHDGEHHAGHAHHHHHHHEGGEVEEYGIGTFVYYRRRPFDLALFDEFVARKWPRSVIRAKGICYFRDEPDTCYVFEQAGKQMGLRNAGRWYATMPKDELDALKAREEGLRRDWDETYGDRMQKLVFIGQHLDKEAIIRELDKSLVD